MDPETATPAPRTAEISSRMRPEARRNGPESSRETSRRGVTAVRVAGTAVSGFIALSCWSAALEHYLGVVLDELPSALGQQQPDRVLHVTAFQQGRRHVEEIAVRLAGALLESVP